ncbi:MAG: TetR/AcrR family transcriptional regulator [Chloroflexi bacterium]|nr:TetR/AcrR family transcriptional regulator [Chloroflexota bacterium]
MDIEKKPRRVKRRTYKDERLKQIVKTAAKLFYKNGYAQTTTRQIAEACGISQGNLYYYIKSKEDFFNLFVDMTTSTFEGYDSEIRSQLPRISHTEAMKRRIKEGLRLINAVQDMILFLYRESRIMSPDHLDQVIRQELHIVDLLKTIIEAGCKTGEFGVKDPQLAAYQILMLEHMWSLKRWYLRKHYTLEEYIVKCQEAAVGIVRAREVKKTVKNTAPARKTRK